MRPLRFAAMTDESFAQSFIERDEVAGAQRITDWLSVRDQDVLAQHGEVEVLTPEPDDPIFGVVVRRLPAE